MNKTWFEMKDIRKRHLTDAVWVPLHVSDTLTHEGKFGLVGFKEEFFGLGSVAFPTGRREEASNLGWSDIGITHNHGVWATEDYYKPVDVFQHHDRTDLGVDLVLIQTFGTDDADEWHLSQDLVFALGLMRQGDNWVRPSEDYREVARLSRNRDGRPVSLEIKNEYLRDYLRARNMFLRTSQYRLRDMIVENLSEIGSPQEDRSQVDGGRFELRILPIIEGGHPADSGFAVFNMHRIDVDPDEDVPRPGPETEENTSSHSWTGKHEGLRLFRVLGELWRDENIEPSEHSPRVRGDIVPSGVQFIVDAAGNRLPSEALDDESDPRWLWFQPDVIPALLKHRGGELCWYTQNTGGVSCSYGSLTHFGLNDIGLVTVYAYDVAKIPAWQQRVWAAHNVTPEGKVSRELLQAQMEAKPAGTSAPEAVLPIIMTDLNRTFIERTGAPLLRSHDVSDELTSSISRFRAIEKNGLFSLAKDLTRLVADRIDVGLLHKLCPPPKNEKWGSIKSLEKYLATIVSTDQARLIMRAIAGTNDLRIADAHPPSHDLSEAYELVRVDPTASPLDQGFWLIASFVSALIAVSETVEAAPEPPQASA